jgi:hypothetical protein
MKYSSTSLPFVNEFSKRPIGDVAIVPEFTPEGKKEEVIYIRDNLTAYDTQGIILRGTLFPVENVIVIVLIVELPQINRFYRVFINGCDDLGNEILLNLSTQEVWSFRFVSSDAQVFNTNMITTEDGRHAFANYREMIRQSSGWIPTEYSTACSKLILECPTAKGMVEKGKPLAGNNNSNRDKRVAFTGARQSSTSGGWEWSTEDHNVTLRFFYMDYSGIVPKHIVTNYTLEQAKEMIEDAFQTRISPENPIFIFIDSRNDPDQPSNWQGVQLQSGAKNHLCIVSMQWRKMPAVDALRAINTVFPVSYAMAAGILSASESIENNLDLQRSGYGILNLIHAPESIGFLPNSALDAPQYTRKELEGIVENYTIASVKPFINFRTTLNPIDYARALRLLSCQLMQPNWVASHADLFHDLNITGLFISILMLCDLSLQNNPALSWGGEKWPLLIEPSESNESYSSHLYFCVKLYFALLLTNLPVEVLRGWCGPGYIPLPKIPMADFQEKLFEVDDVFHVICDDPRAKPLLASIIKEAHMKAAYSPYGCFRARLPKGGVPLQLPDHNVLLLFVDGPTIWYTASSSEIPLYPSFGRVTFDKADEDYSGATELTNAIVTIGAIWHDMKISAEKAFPQSSEQDGILLLMGGPRKRHKQQIDKNIELSMANNKSQYRSLPRFVASGMRMWGSQRERDFLVRRHHVTAFRRHLPAGWKRSENALDRAVELGIILPEGYTVVRGHERGKGGRGPHQPAPMIRCRGLAALMALMKKEEKESNLPDEEDK